MTDLGQNMTSMYYYPLAWAGLACLPGKTDNGTAPSVKDKYFSCYIKDDKRTTDTVITLDYLTNFSNMLIFDKLLITAMLSAFM